MKPIHLLCMVLLAMCICTTIASALPTTEAATAVGNRNVTFNMSGYANPIHWIYGLNSLNESWTTRNITGVGTYANWTEVGPPLIGGYQYYYRACDATGCGGELTFTLSSATPNPQTTFGTAGNNITSSHFDPFVLATSIIEPYTWVLPSLNGRTIFWFLIFFFVYTAMWLRQRNTFIPAVVGLLVGGMFWTTGSTIFAMPPDVISIVQALTYASIAGVGYSIFK